MIWWRAGAYAALAAAIFGAGWTANGWRIEGQNAAALKQAVEARDKAAADLADMSRKASEAEARRLVAELDRAHLAQQLEDEAREDPDASGGLPVGRVLRLNRR